MKAGVSTACLYPTELEKAFGMLAKNGVKNVEIFVNSHCELSDPYRKEMLDIQSEYDVNVVSVHPYTSGIEPMMLFTKYERRVRDMLEYYKRFFEYMNLFGAKIMVIHGNKPQNFCEDELYFERFARLQDAASEMGVSVAQENVARCTSGKLEFLKKMADALRDKAKFVLDTKQAHRCGEDPIEMVKAIGKHIVHVHFSDYGAKGDCLKFGEGDYDNLTLFTELKKCGYDGMAVIELYKGSYLSAEDLADNSRRLGDFLEENNF